MGHLPAESPADPSPMSLKTKRERLRFQGIHQTRGPEGERVLEVELEWQGTSYYGRSTGIGSIEGDLRAVGEATVDAVEAATHAQVSLQLVGVKLVRAFDGQVIIASVSYRGEKGNTKLLGTYAVNEVDLSTAAVLAVLSSLNRIVAPLLEEAAPARASERELPTAS
jgi:hypothetical protein